MSNDVTKILAAAAVGLAAGIAIGFLFAPDKGSETRKKVRKKVEDIADRFGEELEERFGPFKKSAEDETGEEVPGQHQP